MRERIEIILTQLRGARRSLTVWFNGLLLTALPYAEDIIGFIRQALPELQAYLPDNWYKVMGVVVVVVNLLLRLKTKAALADKGRA